MNTGYDGWLINNNISVIAILTLWLSITDNNRLKINVFALDTFDLLVLPRTMSLYILYPC